MADVKLERVLNAPIEKVFAFVSKSEHLMKWWGPEGMTLPDCNLEFSKLGKWHSVMQNSEGQRFTVSGQVTSVDRPNSIAFTWAWHDENNVRGDESHVVITLKARDDGKTDFTLHHQQLVSEESATSHAGGWNSSLRKLEKLAA